MFTFEPADFALIGVLILLEGLLSADNALVLALLVRHLPHEERGKALLYGLIGAFVFRGLGIFFAARLIHLWWVCAGGALYLIYLAATHFFSRSSHASHAASDGEPPPVPTRAGFWKTIFLVEVTDIIFAIDSILVAVALVSEDEKIWIIYVGGIMGLVLLRLVASGFTRLIEKFPALDNLAYALVAWAGVKLASASVDIFQKARGLPEPHLLPKWAFWVGFALILLIGVPLALKYRAPVTPATDPTPAEPSETDA